MTECALTISINNGQPNVYIKLKNGTAINPSECPTFDDKLDHIELIGNSTSIVCKYLNI